MNAITTIVSTQRAALRDPAASAAFARLSVPPYASLRRWNYGGPDDKFSCWIVAESARQNLAVAYCDQGFGPMHPWGVVLLRGDDFQMSLGMDSDWFGTLEEVLTQSWASRRLLSA